MQEHEERGFDWDITCCALFALVKIAGILILVFSYYSPKERIEWLTNSERTREQFVRTLGSATLKTAIIQPQVLEIPGEISIRQQPHEVIVFDAGGTYEELIDYYYLDAIRFEGEPTTREWIILPFFAPKRSDFELVFHPKRRWDGCKGWKYQFTVQRLLGEPATFQLSLIDTPFLDDRKIPFEYHGTTIP